MTYPPQQPPVMPGYQQPPQGDWTPPRTKRGPLPWLIGALVVAVLLVGGLLFALFRGADPAGTAASALTPDPGATFAEIRSTCGAVAGYDVEDGGHTLIINVGGAFMNASTAACVFDHLGMPTAVREHVNTTRALDGQQTDQWPGYTARWTYHPDDGLQMTIRTA